MNRNSFRRCPRYLDFYNRRRPHSSLDGGTPDRAYFNRCRSARQPNRGRRTTYRRGDSVQTIGFSSHPMLRNVIAAFYYHPEWIKWGLRTITHGIETVADAVPYPWGDRIEIALRELGGFIWFQVTLAIIALRVLLSSMAAVLRRLHR